jgi:hypothetical protein
MPWFISQGRNEISRQKIKTDSKVIVIPRQNAAKCLGRKPKPEFYGAFGSSEGRADGFQMEDQCLFQ